MTESASTASVVETCKLELLEPPTAERVRLAIPHTDYRLDLVPGIPPEDFPKPKSARNPRVRGTITAKALRVHGSEAGGNYIEPIDGHPRIVQGRVIARDPANHRLLVDVVVPMWIELREEQGTESFATGDVVNFYVESGVVFVPA